MGHSVTNYKLLPLIEKSQYESKCIDLLNEVYINFLAKV